MKKIYVNLKRFDVPPLLGGVNRLVPMDQWGTYISQEVSKRITPYLNQASFSVFYPEAHLLPAIKGNPGLNYQIGCQGVYREDLDPNFGAFTTNRPASAMKALGVSTVIIGHCEERKDLKGILEAANIQDVTPVHYLLNQSVKCATEAGLEVLFCIGETAEEQKNWQEVLKQQLEVGLEGINRKKVTIAYEPVWAIGPGKTPPDRMYIQKVGSYIKSITDGLPLVYGGGLKEDNARMLASIPEIDGGLIALTRFTGDIGFYPEEFEAIVQHYLNNKE